MRHRPDDVLLAAWQAAGEPDPGVPLEVAGTCVRCVRATVGAPLDAVVSGKYGDWDRLAGRAAPGVLVWCPPCAWGHRHLPLRTRPHLIEPGGCRPLAAGELRAALAGALPPRVAVLVPLSRHKHLAPFANWGMITTDDAELRWTIHDAGLLDVAAWLRAAGVPAWALRHPGPPADAVAHLDVATRAGVVLRWGELDPWRRRPPWLEVAIRATSAAATAGLSTVGLAAAAGGRRG
jgi:hypothetical protein